MSTLEFLVEEAKGLRKDLGLYLFNFDMIRYGEGDGYLVIDMNYFPGYEKFPSYETVMIDFFLNVMKLQELENMKKKEIDDSRKLEARLELFTAEYTLLITSANQSKLAPKSNKNIIIQTSSDK
uniref:inositol-1,3,4-trisphosphate 5/6-kinase n=1 Tax=Lactuca sativa TaxID=4236 RepID=A0A9R1UPU6_LACSA|nr:hypothetical protein LSAT_V11C800390260 [Lactuca sativa]